VADGKWKWEVASSCSGHLTSVAPLVLSLVSAFLFIVDSDRSRHSHD